MLILIALFASSIFVGVVTGNGQTVIIDVRTESEWNAGHLEGAVLIPHEQIGQEISKISSDRKTKIYLYCRSGRRTGLAFDILKKSGYEDIINLVTMENSAKEMNNPIVK